MKQSKPASKGKGWCRQCDAKAHAPNAYLCRDHWNAYLRDYHAKNAKRRQAQTRIKHARKQGKEPDPADLEIVANTPTIAKAQLAASGPKTGRRVHIGEQVTVTDARGRTYIDRAKIAGMTAIERNPSNDLCRIQSCRTARYRSPSGLLKSVFCLKHRNQVLRSVNSYDREHPGQASPDMAARSERGTLMTCPMPGCTNTQYVGRNGKKVTQKCQMHFLEQKREERVAKAAAQGRIIRPRGRYAKDKDGKQLVHPTAHPRMSAALVKPDVPTETPIAVLSGEMQVSAELAACARLLKYVNGMLHKIEQYAIDRTQIVNLANMLTALEPTDEQNEEV